jgi:hypothetical protein
MLEKRPDRINWFHLSENPSIFYKTYDYPKIKETIGDKIRHDLIQETGKPHRVQYITEHFYDGDFELYWNSR